MNYYVLAWLLAAGSIAAAIGSAYLFVVLYFLGNWNG